MIDDTEIRPIPGHERYGITAVGAVYRLAKRGSDKPLAVPKRIQAHTTQRYPQVSLYDEDGREMCYVHELVARTWLGPRPIGAEIHHRNRRREEATTKNLEYVTDHETHMLAHLDQVRRKLTPFEVLEIRRRYAAGGVLQRELADEFEIDQSVVSDIIRRKIWKWLT